MFDRDFKKLLKKHYDINSFKKVAHLISINDIDTLKQRYNWHPLHGDKAGVFDVHVVNYQDWILLYMYLEPDSALVLATGGHDILKRDIKALLP